MKKVVSAIQNYLWSGSLHRARTKVAWMQCCLSKVKGVLNVINPKDSLAALMTKWVLKACEPGESNLQIMLRHRLMAFQPYQGGRWGPSMEFFTLDQAQARQGSKAWTRAGKAWKCLLPEVLQRRPQTRDEVMSESFGGRSSCRLLALVFLNCELHSSTETASDVSEMRFCRAGCSARGKPRRNSSFWLQRLEPGKR